VCPVLVAKPCYTLSAVSPLEDESEIRGADGEEEEELHRGI